MGIVCLVKNNERGIVWVFKNKWEGKVPPWNCPDSVPVGPLPFEIQRVNTPLDRIEKPTVYITGFQ
jgi:hypothetical protein